jgi:hypothetical protein
MKVKISSRRNDCASQSKSSAMSGAILTRFGISPGGRFQRAIVGSSVFVPNSVRADARSFCDVTRCDQPTTSPPRTSRRYFSFSLR